jgi:hypothetical protein
MSMLKIEQRRWVGAVDPRWELDNNAQLPHHEPDPLFVIELIYATVNKSASLDWSNTHSQAADR